MEGMNQILPSDEFPHWKTRVEKVKEYVSQNLAGDLRIATVCRKFNLNKFTLQHIFKEQQKETYHEYVEGMRMEKAFEMITKGERTQQTMYATGYHYRSSFNKAFKRRFKHPPAYFRNKDEQ